MSQYFQSRRAGPLVGLQKVDFDEGKINGYLIIDPENSLSVRISPK